MPSSLAKNQIVHIREFLEKYLRKKVLNYSLRALTKPGDNYGSNIHALTVTVTHNDDKVRCGINCLKTVKRLKRLRIFIFFLQAKPEVLELVVKTPVTNEYLVSIYLPAISCVKENAFYSEFIPAMKQLQNEAGVPGSKQINGFIEYVGSRLSLDVGRWYLHDAIIRQRSKNYLVLHCENRC